MSFRLAADAFAEFVASLFFVWTVAASKKSEPPVLTTACAAGFVATALSYATGALFNPVLTLARVTVNRLPVQRAASAIGAQILGGIVAGAILMLTSGDDDLGGNALPIGSKWYDSLIGEILATSLLVYAVLRADNETTPIVLGMAILAGHAVLLPVSSCAMNPVRTLGPALVAWRWPSSFWTFLVGPVVGAALAIGASFIADALNDIEDDPRPQAAPDIESAMQRYQEAARNFP